MKKLFFIAFLLISILATAQHTIVLKSGEKIECVVLGLENDVWTIYKDRNENKIDMKEVSSVFFNEYVPYDGSLKTDIFEKELKVDGYVVKFQLKDRSLIRNPKISIGTEDKGTVVVKIVVDKYGNVRSAEPGAPGSTTSSAYLYAKAATAAKSAKFDENLKGPINTEGTITIIY